MRALAAAASICRGVSRKEPESVARPSGETRMPSDLSAEIQHCLRSEVVGTRKGIVTMARGMPR